MVEMVEDDFHSDRPVNVKWHNLAESLMDAYINKGNNRKWKWRRMFPNSFRPTSPQSLNLGGRRDTADDVATIPFHPSLSFAALRESQNPIPVHSLMLSSHLFFCLPLLLAPFTVPCRTFFAMPEDLEMWPYHLSFRLFSMIRRSSCTPIAFWILLRTSSFDTWSL